MTSTEKSTEQLRREWVEHRFFRYRGCAPDPDDPMRMAGDPTLHVGAHHGPDAWKPEKQKERQAREALAAKVCQGCAVRVQCDAYASSVTPDGKLAEPEGVWGGRLGVERRRAFKDRQKTGTASPTTRLRTPQKLAVLRALAVCWEPFEVAAVAGVDVRTANWQRSNIVTHLGLPRKATRAQLLAVAAERGLLEGLRVIEDDGSVPAIPPPTRVASGGVPTQLELWQDQLAVKDSAARPARARRRARGGRVELAPTLDDALTADAGLAPVIPLFPARRLEAAV